MTFRLNILILVTLMSFVSGCSLWPFGKKDESKLEVVDASAASTDPVEVGSGAIDAGKYMGRDDYDDVANHGGRGGYVIPEEKFYSVDREQNAPVGKMLFFLTDESPARCVMGKYTMVENRKKLMVYTQSPVPTNYCVYQKTFSEPAEGFSLHLVNGSGVCRPSFAIKERDSDRMIASVDVIKKNIPFKYCVENTISYGQEVAKRKRQ